MASTEIKISIVGDNSKIVSSLKKTEKQVKTTANNIKINAGTSGKAIAGGFALGTLAVKAFEFAMRNAVKVLKVFSVDSIAIFAEFEAGLKQVQKTTGLTSEEIVGLGDDLLKISENSPIAISSLISIAKTAGQLGIQGSENIKKVTESVAIFAETTNATADLAITALPRILQFSRDSIQEIDRLTSSITLLGSTTNATEADITDTAVSVGKSLAPLRLASADIVAISTAFVTVGESSEVAGSTTAKAIKAVDNALINGGKALKSLEELTGKTADELTKIRSEDPAQIFVELAQGLKRATDEGKNIDVALRDIGISEIRAARGLKGLSAVADNFTDILARSRQEFEDNTRLQNEYAVQTDTLKASLSILKNSFNSLQTSIGRAFAPAVRTGVDFLSKSIVFFKDKILPSVIQRVKEIIDSFKPLVLIFKDVASGGSFLSPIFLRIIKIAFELGSVFIKIQKVAFSLVRVFVAFRIGIFNLTKAISIGLFKALFGAIKTFGSFIASLSVVKDVTSAISTAFSFLSKALKFVTGVFGAVAKEASKVTDSFSFIGTAIDKVVSVARKAGKLLAPFFSSFKEAIDGSIDSVKELGGAVANVSDAVVGKKKEEEKEDGGGEFPTPDNEGLKNSLDERNALVEASFNDERAIRDGADAQRDARTEKQLQIERQSAQDSLALEKAKQEGIGKAELDFLQKQQDIKRQFLQADLIDDQVSKQATLERLQILQDMLTEEQQSFSARQAEIRQLERELLTEEQQEFDAEVLEKFRENLKTKEDIRREFEERETQEIIKSREKNQNVQNAFGANSIALDKKISQAKLGILVSAGEDFLQEGAKQNKELFEINKAVGISSAIISSGVAINRALSEIPYPANLGAAALIAGKTAFQVNRLRQETPAFREGGVMAGAPGVDNNLAFVGNGERVLTQAQNETFRQLENFLKTAGNTTENNDGRTFNINIEGIVSEETAAQVQKIVQDQLPFNNL